MTRTIEKPLLVLVGPTAIGKTALSIELAKEYNCEIISMDSMQIYKHMNIGTAKVTEEEQKGIPHHLIDIVTPDEDYDAARFCKDAILVIDEIHGRGKIPLLTGGTGLYLRALTEGLFQGPPGDKAVRDKLQKELDQTDPVTMHKKLEQIDPESAQKIHSNDSYRTLRALEVFALTSKPLSRHFNEQQQEYSFKNIHQIALTSDRDKLYERINLRSEIMLKQGFEKEVRELLEMGYSRDLKSMGAIGYRHMVNYIFKEWDFNEMLRLLKRDTRRYAKRQYTWFNKNSSLNWFDVQDSVGINKSIKEWLAKG